MDYAIRYVFDANTGEAFDATIAFKTIPLGQAFRKNYHVTDQEIRCQECFQKATVSDNKSGRVYFKHFPNTAYCILKDEELSPSDRQKIEEHLGSVEGERHKFLKKSISSYLSEHAGVDSTSITVDDHFVKDSLEKRRPDIFCNFQGKQIAFEIQVSPLPAKYIFKRHEFYLRNQIYLIWILDDFDVKGQTQTEKDIKYLNKHQNFFYFNDLSSTQTLVAQFKEGFVNSQNKMYFKWKHEFISLNDLHFDNKEYQVYYRSLEKETQKAEGIIAEKELPFLIKFLREFYRTDHERYIQLIDKELEDIDYKRFQAIDRKVVGNTAEIFFKSLEGTGKRNFIIFLLKSVRFSKPLNTKNSSGMNLLEFALRANFNYTPLLLRLFFSNGYELSDSDRVYLQSTILENETDAQREQRILKIYGYNVLRDFRLIEIYDRMEGPMLTLLSAKHRRIIGMGFTNFVSLANNAIQSYKTSWPYIEKGFKHYGIWESILSSDKKHSFQNKLSLISHEKIQASWLDEVLLILTRLFPDVFPSEKNPIPWLQSIDELSFVQTSSRSSTSATPL
ncbi:MAG TPA: DUF6035 family protein [Cyclobacteriaceae bacterium]|jgi:hypothetical protein|nr:DUF6035 family protein [Cyclobacteriaceae bacterium]